MDKLGYSNILEVFAEMVIEEALRKFHRQRLYEQIDRALAAGDEHRFYALTDELKSLTSAS